MGQETWPNWGTLRSASVLNAGCKSVLQDVKDTCHPNSNLPFAELLYCSSCSFLYMFKQNVLATFGAEFTKAIVSQVHGKQNAVLGLLVV